MEHKIKRPIIGSELRIRWQRLAELMIEEMEVKVAFIMQKVDDDLMQVFVASRTDENPYVPGHHFKIKGTFSGAVLDSADFLLVPDARKDDRFDENPATKVGYNYYQGFPVLWPDGEVFGTISVLDVEDNPKATQEKKLLEEFKLMVEQDLVLLEQQAALSIEHRQRLLAEEELRNLSPKEFNSLWKAAKAVLVTNNFEDSARIIFDEACAMTGATSGYVALLSDDGSENEVLFLEAGGLPCTVDPSLPMPIRGLRGESYSKHQAMFENDFMNSPWVKFMPEGHVVLKNVMFSPLNIEEQTVGIIGLANKEGDFTDFDSSVASAFGDLAAIALKKSQMMDGATETNRRLESFNESLVDREMRIIEMKKEVNELCRAAGEEIRYKEIDNV